MISNVTQKHLKLLEVKPGQEQDSITSEIQGQGETQAKLAPSLG